MRRLLFLFAILIFALPAYSASLLFHEALQRGQISVEAKGRGGFNGDCLKIRVLNKTNAPIEIKLLPGTIFESENEDLQNLVVTREEILTIQPKSDAILSLSTMCIQSHNMSPFANSIFRFAQMASGDLKKLVGLIASKGYSGHSTAQSAVWAITDGASINEIYGSDTSMVRALAGEVSDALNVDISNFNFTPRAHRILSLSGSMECFVETKTPKASLKAYRKDNGQMLRAIFKDYPVKPGFYQFRFGIHHSLGDSIPFVLKLEDEAGQVLFEKEVGYHEEVPEMRKMNQEQFITFDLEKPTRGRVGIYDDQDRLYILMYDNKDMQQGFHKVHFIEGRDLPSGRNYFIKVKDMEGNTLVSDPLVEIDAPSQKFRPMVKRGYFTFTLKEGITDARLDIFDEYGRKIWVVFEDSRLRAGQKRIPYAFQHRQGPNAAFTWKLVDGNGNVLEEREVK